MQNGNQGFGGTRWRSLMVAAVATIGTLWTSVAMATITQGDFSVYGFFETRESGQWGKGSSSQDSTPTTFLHPTPTSTYAAPGKSFGITGGSFDFNHWDLVEVRQLADIRPDYHMVKNYKLLGRFDTLIVKDADFFAYYGPGTTRGDAEERRLRAGRIPSDCHTPSGAAGRIFQQRSARVLCAAELYRQLLRCVSASSRSSGRKPMRCREPK